MYEMLKKIKITPQLNKNGLLDELQNSFQQEEKLSKVKINITTEAKPLPPQPKIAYPIPTPVPVVAPIFFD